MRICSCIAWPRERDAKRFAKGEPSQIKSAANRRNTCITETADRDDNRWEAGNSEQTGLQCPNNRTQYAPDEGFRVGPSSAVTGLMRCGFLDIGNA